MKYIKHFRTHTLLSLVLITALALTGCNNPAGDDHDDELDPRGLVLYMNGVEIAAQNGSQVTGEIEVLAGEETDLINLYFLDAEGSEFRPPTGDFSLRFQVESESIAEVEQHEGEIWSFHLVGLQEGETEIEFILFHDEEGHEEFTSLPFPVTVNSAN